MASGNTEIVAKIKNITNALNGMRNAAKDAAASAKLVGQAFENNIDGRTAAEAFNAYQVAIDKTKAAIDEYKSKIAELEAAQAGLDKSSKTYAADFATLTGKIATQKNALAKLTEQHVELSLAQSKYSQASIAAAEAERKASEEKERTAEKLDKLRKRQQAFTKVLRTAQVVISALVVAFKKLTNAAVEQGTELYSLSKRYGATVEEIQTMNRALQLATGQSDLFTNSLAVLAKGMSDIAGNRGQKYTAALKAIGTSYKALSEMSKGEQFRTIVEGLQNIENESIRAAHAQTLLGESGQYIVGALENSRYSLEDYVKQAEQYSKITTKNAQDLTFLGFKMDAIKSQINVITAKMVTDVEPMILGTMNLLKTLTSVISWLTKHSWLLFAVIIALIAVKFFSAILSWRIALLSATAAATKATTAMVVFKAAVGGVVAVAGIAATAFALWGASANQLEDSVNSAADAVNNLRDMSGDYNSNVIQTYNSRNERTVDIYVEFDGHGDTPVSDAAASMMAQLAVEEVDRSLGIKVKGN